MAIAGCLSIQDGNNPHKLEKLLAAMLPEKAEDWYMGRGMETERK